MFVMLQNLAELVINKGTLEMSIIIKVYIFNAGIDSQFQELNHRFTEHAMKLLMLSLDLNPREAYESFRVSNILYKYRERLICS